MPAAWSICGVDLDPDEEPTDGSQIQFGSPHKWVFANAAGLRGRIKQYVYTDAREHKLHLLVSAATKDALKAVADAHAGGSAPLPFVNPEPPFDVGVNVTMTEFSAEWNDSVRGLPWFDVSLVLVE